MTNEIHYVQHPDAVCNGTPVRFLVPNMAVRIGQDYVPVWVNTDEFVSAARSHPDFVDPAQPANEKKYEECIKQVITRGAIHMPVVHFPKYGYGVDFENGRHTFAALVSLNVAPVALWVLSAELASVPGRLLHDTLIQTEKSAAQPAVARPVRAAVRPIHEVVGPELMDLLAGPDVERISVEATGDVTLRRWSTGRKEIPADAHLRLSPEAARELREAIEELAYGGGAEYFGYHRLPPPFPAEARALLTVHEPSIILLADPVRVLIRQLESKVTDDASIERTASAVARTHALDEEDTRRLLDWASIRAPK